jgi:hypothetical protein
MKIDADIIISWLEKEIEYNKGNLQITAQTERIMNIIKIMAGSKTKIDAEDKDKGYIKASDAYEVINGLVVRDEENNALFDNELAGQLVINKLSRHCRSLPSREEVAKMIDEKHGNSFLPKGNCDLIADTVLELLNKEET